MATEGKDISMYNNIKDAVALKKAISFLLIRAGEQNYEDIHFRTHVSIARANQIPLGLWWFMQPDYSPDIQAQKFNEIYASLGTKQRMFLDCENISYTLPDGTKVLINPRSMDEYTWFVTSWLEQVKAFTGIVPGIYTAYYFWQQWVHTKGTTYNYNGVSHVTPDWSQYPLWVANWEVQTPMIPHGWTNWTFWQYGARVTPGIWNTNPTVDQTDSDRFNGTPQEVATYLNLGTQPSPIDISKIHLGWPCNPIYPITQHFGEHPENYQIWGLPGHEGIDFGVPNGQQVFAMETGEVSEIRPASNGNPYGNCVVLHHETEDISYRTFYAHLQSCSVVVGQQITKGQVVGLSDSTGNSSGPHLHITVKILGYQTPGWPVDYIDPMLVLVGAPQPPVGNDTRIIWWSGAYIYNQPIADRTYMLEWIGIGTKVHVVSIANGFAKIDSPVLGYILSTKILVQ